MMERLTEKINDYGCYAIFNVNDAIRKLGKLEDLEEELGIPLEVLFKALKEGFYYKSKTPDGIFMYPQINTTIGHQKGEWFIGCYTWWLTKDYGKTWALTEEELEND